MINHTNIFSTLKNENNDHFSSQESFKDKKIEQNDINRQKYEMSIEDDETFEDAAAEDQNSDDMDSMDDQLDDMESNIDSLDDSSSSDGDFNDSMDDSGDSNGSGGIDDIEKNRGSSLNPFTQINQKNYLIDELNELSDSIQHTISEYNTTYADWSELNQLRELKVMLDEERNSFVMQQNPENLIKLRLYMTQYETIVKKLSSMISDKAKRDSNLLQNNKSNPISKN